MLATLRELLFCVASYKFFVSFFLLCDDFRLSHTSLIFSIFENEQKRERGMSIVRQNKVLQKNVCVCLRVCVCARTYVHCCIFWGDHSQFLLNTFFPSCATNGYILFLIFSVFMLTDDLTVNISVKYISSTPVIKRYRLPCTCDTILE